MMSCQGHTSFSAGSRQMKYSVSPIFTRDQSLSTLPFMSSIDRNGFLNSCPRKSTGQPGNPIKSVADALAGSVAA